MATSAFKPNHKFPSTLFLREYSGNIPGSFPERFNENKEKDNELFASIHEFG